MLLGDNRKEVNRRMDLGGRNWKYPVARASTMGRQPRERVPRLRCRLKITATIDGMCGTENGAAIKQEISRITVPSFDSCKPILVEQPRN